MKTDLSYDAIVALLIASGMAPEQVCAILLSPDYLSELFIESEIALSIGEMKRREIEDRMDVLISPFLEQHARSMQFFHIANYPFRSVYSFVINGILSGSGTLIAWSPRARIGNPCRICRFCRQSEATWSGWAQRARNCRKVGTIWFGSHTTRQ